MQSAVDILNRKWPFVEELSKDANYHLYGSAEKMPPQSVDISCGINLVCDFPDQEHLLETAIFDIEQFLKENSLKGSYPVRFRFRSDFEFEQYGITVTNSFCELIAGDTEGMRRAIYELEEMISASCGKILPSGSVLRKPWLKSRISRCFFSPTKRGHTPNDELADEIDYYPEAYLQKFARDGINGIWLVGTFQELAVSRFRTTAHDRAKRIEKLQYTVDKCRRYGIRVFLFVIEPFAVLADDPLFLTHPEMFGADFYGRHCFCPSVPETREYLRECTRSIFRDVSRLGGLICITHGERPTTCLSAVRAIDANDVPCPRCAKLPKDKIIRATLQAMLEGMRGASPDALLISWFYMPWGVELSDWAVKIGKSVPQGVIAQFNFESGGRKNQCGKEHTAGDYWLSYTGPSEHFCRQCEAVADGVEISAKLQMCCGHELGTVPMIPVPGLLYRKFKAMKESGVRHSMLCWYLGNVPGLMSHAAGKLAFEDFSRTEEEFLETLSIPEWGEAGKNIVRTLKMFSDAYENLPFSLLSQYYGPQNAGVVWPLTVFPELKPLAPPWKPEFPPDGDAIGEALAGFTISEELGLFRKMQRQWHTGSGMLSRNLAFAHFPQKAEQLAALVQVLGLIFESSADILEFYLFRHRLFEENDSSVLKKMEALCLREIEISSTLTALCEKYPMFGFHSEAMAYCFSPDSLQKRVNHLKRKTLAQISDLKVSLASGKCAWNIFTASIPENAVLTDETEYPSEYFSWSFSRRNGVCSMKIYGKKWNGFAVFLMDGTGIGYPQWIYCTKDILGNLQKSEENLYVNTGHHNDLYQESRIFMENDCFLIEFPESILPQGRYFRMNLYASNQTGFYAASGKIGKERLILWFFDPSTAFLVPEDLMSVSGKFPRDKQLYCGNPD